MSTNHEVAPQPISRRGFTIVELLIVIVVIGILAAIVIVAYNGISKNAARSVLRSDASQSIRLLQNYRTDNSIFPTVLTSLPKALPDSGDTTYEYTATNTTFCLTASSTRAALSYYVTESNIIQEGTCPGHFGLNPPVALPQDMLAISFFHVCALAYNSAPYCWGDGGDGALGRNSNANSAVPVAMTTSGALAGKTVTAIAAGYQFTCVIASGQAYCMGSQTYCELAQDTCTAYNTMPDILVPTAVSTTGLLSGKTFTKIDAGRIHACGLASGEVFCWGDLTYGKLGGNTGTHYATNVSGPVNASAGSAIAGKTVTSLSTGSDVTCAVADGAAYCWGQDYYGQLGNGDGVPDNVLQLNMYSRVPLPVDTTGVLAGKTVTQVDVGVSNEVACAIADGQAYCWGQGSGGRLGDGLSTNSESPVAVSTSGVLAGKTVTDISVGNQNHACLIADGQAYCWGGASNGRLGNGTTTPAQTTPVAVSTSGVLAGKTLVKIEAGYDSTCAMSSDNLVYCWGSDGAGRLGNGATTTADQTTAVQVTAP